MTLTLRGTTVTLFAATSPEPSLSRYSLGKNLFAQALDAAIAARSAVFDFLAVGEYKEAFWGAHGRELETSILGRGSRGRLAVAYAATRRQALPVVSRRLRALRVRTRS